MVFENLEIVFSIKIHTFGGLFEKKFKFEASLKIFLIFRNIRGPFLVEFLVFENFEIIF